MTDTACLPAPADPQLDRRNTISELPIQRDHPPVARWQQQFYKHIADAAALLSRPEDSTLRRQAIISLKLTINLSDKQDLNREQAAERNRAARAYNHLIPLEERLRFQPAVIIEE